MRSGLMTACFNTDGKEPNSRLSLTDWVRVGRKSSKQSRNSEVGKGLNVRVVGQDFRITLLSFCSDTGENDSRIDDEHKSGHTTGEEEIVGQGRGVYRLLCE